jgi:hypothetical protein
MTTVCCVYSVYRMLKSNDFCEASQATHCQRSKTLPSPKQGCNLLIISLKTASKNYGTNSPNSQKAITARNPNAIYRMCLLHNVVDKGIKKS